MWVLEKERLSGLILISRVFSTQPFSVFLASSRMNVSSESLLIFLLPSCPMSEKSSGS